MLMNRVYKRATYILFLITATFFQKTIEKKYGTMPPRSNKTTPQFLTLFTLIFWSKLRWLCKYFMGASPVKFVHILNNQGESHEQDRKSLLTSLPNESIGFYLHWTIEYDDPPSIALSSTLSQILIVDLLVSTLFLNGDLFKGSIRRHIIN